MSSNGFRESICSKGDFAHKLEYFPNWADGELNDNADYQLPALPEGFKIMFAGNIGEAQDFENTLKAFKLIHDKGISNIHLILVGDGRKKAWVDKYIEDNNLHNIIHCVGRHPLSAMGLFFAKADVLYLALKDSIIFNLTCPAKLQAYMSAGKPILAMINGEGANIISESSCGLSVNAGDFESLANTIVSMSELPFDRLTDMGICGKKFCDVNFSFEKNIQNLEHWISL